MVSPAVAEVEDVGELIARPQLGTDLQRFVVPPVVLTWVDVRESNPASVRQFELVQM